MIAEPEALLARARLLGPVPVPEAVQEFLDQAADVASLALVLRHPLAPTLLGAAARHGCARDPRVAGALVRNPRTPREAATRLVPALRDQDLAHAAGDARLAAALRQRAEATLFERLRERGTGELVAIARLATGRVLEALLAHAETRVVDAALESRHLTASRLAALLVAPEAAPVLLERVAVCWRFRDQYAVRRGLALAPRSPLGLALGQLSSLAPADLREAAAHLGLHPLVRIAAARLAARS